MFKIVTVVVLSFMGMFFISGCVQPDINTGSHNWWEERSPDVVNLSDLVVNLTMSENMISEDGEV